jgi:hypothetical protein
MNLTKRERERLWQRRMAKVKEDDKSKGGWQNIQRIAREDDKRGG